MQTNITFLSASGKRKLVKRFTKDGVDAYPLVKSFTNHTHTLDMDSIGLVKKLGLFQFHAKQGDCLLKGSLTRDIVNESRANLTDKHAPTQNIIFDIDGVRIDRYDPHAELTRTVLEQLAEDIVAMLPPEFHDVSYICHPSASMGMKKDKISFHFDFWLTEPVHPRALKEYLTLLNFELPDFERQLELTATGTALRYKLDRSLADNSRLVYIGTPEFKEVKDPIPEDARVFLVEKQNVAADIGEAVRTTAPAAVETLVKKKIKELRNLQGLRSKRERIKHLTINGVTHGVMTNPDPVHMEYVRETDTFVYYNVNGGDSNAYYVWKDAPQIVHNFKGETNFLFEQADKETYAWHVKTFSTVTTNDGKEVPATLEPIVFRDFRSDTYFNGLYDHALNRFAEIAPASRSSLEDYMACRGKIIPDVIPTWYYEFKPKDPRIIDIKEGFINKYNPSAMLTEPVELPEHLVGLKFGELHKLEELCPTIYKVLHSLSADDDECFDYFLNWLAFIFQRREKTQTAWILQGTTGTGKGVLYNQILRPLLNEHASEKLMQNIEDPYNNWMETNLITCFDEFAYRDSATGEKIMAKLKNLITEPRLTIRGMRANQYEADSYVNAIFLSNKHDVVNLAGDDRRFHVAPRQEKSLVSRYPNFQRTVVRNIKQELAAFASIILQCEIVESKVRIPLENSARQAMKDASLTTVDEFCNAVKYGDMDYFIPVLDMKPAFVGTDFVGAAQVIVKTWLRDYDDDTDTPVWMSDLRPLYNSLVGRCDTDAKLGKIFAHRGMKTEQVKRQRVNKRGFVLQFKCRENSREDLRNHYMSDPTGFDSRPPYTSLQ